MMQPLGGRKQSANLRRNFLVSLRDPLSLHMKQFSSLCALQALQVNECVKLETARQLPERDGTGFQIEAADTARGCSEVLTWRVGAVCNPY